jgi:hypothetical protein
MDVTYLRRVLWLACACALVLGSGSASHQLPPDTVAGIPGHAGSLNPLEPLHGYVPALHRATPPDALKASAVTGTEQDDPADDSDEDLGNSPQPRDAAAARDRVDASARDAGVMPAPHPDAAVPSFLALDPTTPRAPPA